MSKPEVLAVRVTGTQVAQTGNLIHAAVNAPEGERVEAIRELMRYTREVLGIPEREAPDEATRRDQRGGMA